MEQKPQTDSHQANLLIIKMFSPCKILKVQYVFCGISISNPC